MRLTRSLAVVASLTAVAVPSTLGAQFTMRTPVPKAPPAAAAGVPLAPAADDTPAASFLTRSGAGLTDDRAYALTSIFTGYVTRNIFLDFSAARAVSNKDTTAATLTTEEFRRRISNVLTLIQNGGSLSGRVVGQWQSNADATRPTWGSVGFNLSGGGVGVLGEGGDKRGTIGGTLEAMGSVRLRNQALTEVIGEAYGGLRAGVQQVFGGVLETDGQARLPYAQIVFQLRARGTTVLGLSANLVSREFKSYVAPVQLVTTTAF
jgi:hypothetical protein